MDSGSRLVSAMSALAPVADIPVHPHVDVAGLWSPTLRTRGGIEDSAHSGPEGQPSDANPDQGRQSIHDKIAHPRVPPGRPELRQFDRAGESRQTHRVDEKPAWIADFEGCAGHQEDQSVFEIMREISDRSKRRWHNGEDHDEKCHEPARNLKKFLHLNVAQ